MRTIRLNRFLKGIGRLRFFIFFALCAEPALALTQWEVAVLFLGSKENAAYQKDMDRNILELSRSHPNDNYRLSIYREFADRNVEYFVEPKSKKTHSWAPLFAIHPPHEVQVPGVLRSWEKRADEKSLVQEPILFARFSEQAFQNPKAKRILIIYSHGQGFEGLGGGVGLKELNTTLSEFLPPRAGRPLDILWLDACFMANTEAAYELRKTSKILVASEEAEFSAGAPFDMLQTLAWGPDYTYSVAVDFAQRFIESYSYLKKGVQNSAVFKSSATISVIDLRRMDRFVEELKTVREEIAKLSSEERKELKKKVQHLTMDKNEMVDLGQLILALETTKLDSLKHILDLKKPERFRTNPRILVKMLPENQRLVFGYNDWLAGFRGDADSLERMPEELSQSIEGFIPGPRAKEWPERKVLDNFYFSPFSVSMNQFHYYVQEKNSNHLVTKIQTFERTKDFIYFRAENALNPVLFSGYTQGIGTYAERYTGLSIADPLMGLPSFEYADLEFAQKTGWGSN